MPFLRRDSVPVHQNLLLATAAEARSLATGALDLHICPHCGFAFNAAFRPDLLAYGEDYDNTQTWSGAFEAYVDGLARAMVVVSGVRGCRVVEVGCGKGLFLRKLVEFPGADNTGFGFDPSYVGPDVACDGKLRFHRSFYDASAAALKADAVVCRHVIEHVEDPMSLIRSVRSALSESPGARVFFETPDLEWILRHQVVWDLFYEHCSLFTAGSLAAAFASEGFQVVDVRRQFGDQYLWLEARAERTGLEARTERTGQSAFARINPSALARINEVPAIVEMAMAFGRAERTLQQGWQETLRAARRGGEVAVWGAGAKGVTFCSLADPDCERIRNVIDVNPAKQGMFVAGTGHPIVSPEQAKGAGIATILVLNPNYRDEIAQTVAGMGWTARVIDLMRTP